MIKDAVRDSGSTLTTTTARVQLEFRINPMNLGGKAQPDYDELEV